MLGVRHADLVKGNSKYIGKRWHWYDSDAITRATKGRDLSSYYADMTDEERKHWFLRNHQLDARQNA